MRSTRLGPGTLCHNRAVTKPIPDRPAQLDSPTVKTVMKYVARSQVWCYRRTNGRVGGKWRVGAGFRKPVPTLLLDHVGRRSGTKFTTPLLYLADGDDLVVVASQGGMSTNPQWFSNLLAAPDTQVQVRAELRRVHARVADPAERARLWPRLVELYADFESYQAWTERVIPVVILEPR
jgi:deazaflavin-dependent oxidoreductase (nitroreductase family)